MNAVEAIAEYGAYRVITHGCGAWWTGAERSHASCCDRTFSSLSAFERHRKGLRCNPPDSVGLVERAMPGGWTMWGWPAPETNPYDQTEGDPR